MITQKNTHQQAPLQDKQAVNIKPLTEKQKKFNWAVIKNSIAICKVWNYSWLIKHYLKDINIFNFKHIENYKRIIKSKTQSE